MSNENNGRQSADDDARANSRALFDALDPAMRALLIDEARRRDAPRPPPWNEWDWAPEQPSTSRGPLEHPASRENGGPSDSRVNDRRSNSRGPVEPSTSRGLFEASNSRALFEPAIARGFIQTGRSREYFQPLVLRGNDHASTSRGNFQASAPLYQPITHGTNTAPRNFDTERRSGFSTSYAPRSSRGDLTPGLSFSIAARNQYTPVQPHDIYDRAMGPYDAEGVQKMQCASPLAKVKKLVFHDGHFVAIMDDNTSPNIAAASFGEFLSTARGDFCLTAQCVTRDLGPYCIDGWNGFLGGVDSIDAHGQLEAGLIRSIFPNLGGAVDAVAVIPTAPVEMDFQEMCETIPGAATFITIDATKFTHGDTVNAAELFVNSRRDKEKIACLLVITERFPMPQRLGTLLHSLEGVTQNVSCVTLLVNIPPTDDAVTSVRSQGFSRGPIHRRGQNDLYHMYARVRGDRVTAIGFKGNS
uniref:Uncharacterized protein n=1 Tax=Panagrolaimus superbus TaxID=310955 RepID=A0A914XZ72_9BILA